MGMLIILIVEMVPHMLKDQTLSLICVIYCYVNYIIIKPLITVAGMINEC